MATSDITNQLKLLKNEMGTRLQQDSAAYAKLEAENKQLKAEIQKLKASGNNSNQSSVNTTEFQKLYNTISLGLAKSDVHADELESLREKILSMEQQSSLVEGAVANQNTIIQQQSKVIYNGSMMQACEDKFKGDIKSLEKKVKDVENQKILEKVGNVTVNSSNLSALRSQIVAAITTCEKNGVAIKSMKTEVTNVKNGQNGKNIMNTNAPKTNPTGIALSVEELKTLKETMMKGIMQCDKNSKLIDELKKQAEKEEKSEKTESAQKQQPETAGSNDTVRLHQTIKKQAENISKIAANYQNERAALIQKSEYEMRSIKQNNKELLARVLVCEGAKDSIKKALKQAETVGPMLATMKAALEKRPEVKESMKNKKVDSLRLEIMNALVKCREHEKDIADLKNVEAENEAAKAKVDQLIQKVEKPVEKKATQAPKVVMQTNATRDGAEIAAEMAVKMANSQKVEMTMDSDSESESEDEEVPVKAAPVEVEAPKQAPKVVMQTNATRDGADIAAEMAVKMADSQKVEMTMDSDSESESEDKEPVKAAPVKKLEAPKQAPKVVMQTNATRDGADIAAEMAVKMANSQKVEMTMDSDSESDSDDDEPVVAKNSTIRHTIQHAGNSANASGIWENTKNPVKTTKISGYTKITPDDRAPAFNTAKFWNNHSMLPEVDLSKFTKKPVSTPVEAPKKVETPVKVEAVKVETPAPKTAPKAASKKGKKGKGRK